MQACSYTTCKCVCDVDVTAALFTKQLRSNSNMQAERAKQAFTALGSALQDRCHSCFKSYHQRHMIAESIHFLAETCPASNLMVPQAVHLLPALKRMHYCLYSTFAGSHLNRDQPAGLTHMCHMHRLMWSQATACSCWDASCAARCLTADPLAKVPGKPVVAVHMSAIHSQATAQP